MLDILQNLFVTIILGGLAGLTVAAAGLFSLVSYIVWKTENKIND